MNKLVLAILIIILVIITIISIKLICKKSCKCGSNCKCINCKCGSNCSCANESLNEQMQKLWLDHVYWTRIVGVAVLDGINEQSLNNSITRLMKNQQDIADVFGKYYGDNVNKLVYKLLSEHILIAKDILVNLKDNKDNTDNLQKWYDNAKDISNSLSTLSPSFNKEDILNMMNKHLELTTQEFVLYKQGEYEQSINTYNLVENEAIMMGDYFAKAIKA